MFNKHLNIIVSYYSLYVLLRLFIHIMSALEQMRPFFRLCQCVGFFPFRIDIDQQTGKFQQFSFSWRNPVAWWYVALFLSQFFVFFMLLMTVLQETETNPHSGIELPLTISMSLGLSHIIYCLLIFSARLWVTFCFTTLRQAIQQMQIVEQLLGEHPHAHCCRCTVRIRIFIGIIFIFLWVWADK